MKQTRQEKIIKIISTDDIATQEKLLERLKEEGFNVTQATVSRDIKKLGLIKIMTDDGQYKYHSPKLTLASGDDTRNKELFANAVMSVDFAMNTVVIKCRAGMANAACAAFDNMNIESVVGSIAGDDTIFVLLKTQSGAEALVESLKNLLK